MTKTKRRRVMNGVDEDEMIQKVTTRGVDVKGGVFFRVIVRDVADALELILGVWDPEENREEEYPLDFTLDLPRAYPEKKQEVQAYLHQTEGEFDPADFAPEAVGKAVTARSRLFLEAGGTELCVYLKIGDTYEDSVNIEREEAEQFVVFEKE